MQPRQQSVSYLKNTLKSYAVGIADASCVVVVILNIALPGKDLK